MSYLQQNAFDEVDTYTSFSKQVALLTNILTFDQESQKHYSGNYFTIMEGTVALRTHYVTSSSIGPVGNHSKPEGNRRNPTSNLSQKEVDNRRRLKRILSTSYLALMIVDQVEGFTVN